MEPINTNTNNTEFQETFDDHLEMIVQDFNEFREKIAQSSSSGTNKLEDIIDLFINNGREKSYSTEHNTQSHGTTLLEDFNMPKNTLPPHQLQPEHLQGFNINTQIQESEMMVRKMTENTSQNDGGRFPELNSNVGVVTRIKYGDLNCHEAAYGVIGSVFGGCAAAGLDSVIRCLRNELGVKGNCNRTNCRHKMKRKYRGVIETEDMTAGMEIAKIKREKYTTALGNREAHEASIQSQL